MKHMTQKVNALKPSNRRKFKQVARGQVRDLKCNHIKTIEGVHGSECGKCGAWV